LKCDKDCGKYTNSSTVILTEKKTLKISVLSHYYVRNKDAIKCLKYLSLYEQVIQKPVGGIFKNTI